MQRAFPKALAALWLLLAALATPVAAQSFPALTGRVVDQANILPAETEAKLTTQLEALEVQSQRQLVVVTVPDLQGYDEQTFTYQLGREWGIGDAERNDGAILLVAPNERRVRIEAGYGLEGYLTDALSALIIQNVILPPFRSGDMAGGIVAGTQSLISQLQLPPDEAARVAAQAGESRRTDQTEGGFPVGALIWLIFMFLFFVLPIIRGRSRRRKYSKRKKGPWGESDDDDDDWDGGGGFGRTGGFGGGFSGGGGSFGGGGASGGW